MLARWPMRNSVGPLRWEVDESPEEPGSGAPRAEPPEIQAVESEALRWDRQLFMTWDDEPASCPAVIDVTGRARYLVFGPYVALDPGPWRARVSLELCAEAAQRPIAVQFGAEPDYTTVDLPRGVEGLHEVEVEHRLKSGDLAQIRVWLKRAAFHGELRFGGADVQRGQCADRDLRDVGRP